MEFASISVNFADRPLAEALALIAADGGGPLVEIWAGNPAHFRPWDPDDVAAASRALEAAGMRAFSLHAPFGGPDDDLSQPDDDHRQRALAHHRDCIEAAAVLGAPVVVVHPGVRLADGEDIAAAARSIRSLRELAGAAGGTGVRLAVESLPPRYLGGDPDGLVTIVDGVASNAVGICLDTGHCNLSAPVDEWVHALGSRIISIHLHDNDGTGDQHLPPGEGSIDWPRVAEALRQHEYSEPGTLETRPEEGWTFARLKERAAGLLGGL